MQQTNNIIEVVVGVIHNDSKEIFISRRKKNQFMSGYWELPGGKVENNEDLSSALKRELFEEIGIKIEKYNLIQTIQQEYPKRIINLSVYVIEKYSGTPVGKEGQDFSWSSIEKIEEYELLPTMLKIINRLSLPNSYWITPDNHNSNSVFEECNQRLSEGVKIIQLRSKSQLDKAYIDNFNKLCQLNQAKLVLNMPHIDFDEPCDGWHLTSIELMTTSTREFPDDKLFGASAHNLIEAKHAEKISVDYISLSPINETPSHPQTQILGWEKASEIIIQCKVPIYLLGGMDKDSMDKALSIGAQGIAGIRGV
jgi:8-oxo-dGTP diphosphatase